MNVGEFGIVFNLNVNFDLSANTSLSLEITKPNETVLTVVPTMGTVLLATDQGPFAANQYSIYRFAAGDIDQAGTYRARLTYNAAGPTRLISDVVTFTVNP